VVGANKRVPVGCWQRGLRRRRASSERHLAKETVMGAARASKTPGNLLHCRDAMPARPCTRTSHRARFAAFSDVSLFGRYEVELPGPFLIKQCAFGLVATAPMFVATRDEEELAWSDTLFSSFIFI
jgi:hypothetical protein